jgi:hypothetical protein
MTSTLTSPKVDQVLGRLLAASALEEEGAAGPRLAPGAIVAADDITHATMADYLRYVRNPGNGYVTVAFPVADGVEISSWTGAAGAAGG